MPWIIATMAIIGALLFLAIWLTYSFLGALVTLLVAGLVGALADYLVPGDLPYGWLGAIVAGLAGSWLGSLLFGSLGPTVAGISILPALIGAILLAFLVEFIATRAPTTPASP